MTPDRLFAYRLIAGLLGVLAGLGGAGIVTGTPIVLLLSGLLLLAVTMLVLRRVTALRRARQERQDAAFLASQILAQHLRTRAAMATLWRQHQRDHFANLRKN